jgi:hypothetical protein
MNTTKSRLLIYGLLALVVALTLALALTLIRTHGAASASSTASVPTPTTTITATTPTGLAYGRIVLNVGQTLTTGATYARTTVTFTGCVKGAQGQTVTGAPNGAYEIDCSFNLENAGPATAFLDMHNWYFMDMDGVSLSGLSGSASGDGTVIYDVGSITLSAGPTQTIILSFNVLLANASPVNYVATDLTTASGQSIQWEVDGLK